MSQELIPFEQVKSMATAVAKSGLFGVKTPDQALALLLLAQAEGLHPMVAARDYDIIQGRPAKKSEAMMRSFIEAGGNVKWITLTEEEATAEFSHPKGGTVTITWNLEMAKTAGLLAKNGSMYKKYPRQMLRARCVSEGVKTVCPSATGGMYSPEEIRDISADKPQEDSAPKSLEEIVVAQTVEPEIKKEVVDAEFKEEPASVVEEALKRMVKIGVVSDVKSKSGETNGKPWTKHAGVVDGEFYSTFSTSKYELMVKSLDEKKECEIEYEEMSRDGNTYRNILEIVFPETQTVPDAQVPV